MQMSQMTIRQLKAALESMPAEFLDTEFVVFDARTGMRTRFSDKTVSLSWLMSHGRPMVELMGTQDEKQRGE
jgi:hypothetical protein